MSIDSIKEALHAAPFRSFTIRMTSGKEYLVDHPDFISATRSYQTLLVSTEEEGRVEFVDTFLIESLHTQGDTARF